MKQTEEKQPDFFAIDENQLDKEWVAQPKFYHKYAKKAAMARQEMEQAKANMEVIKAEQSQKIRKNPLDFGIEKITEKAIEDAITVSQEARGATEALIDAKHAVEILDAAVQTLEHRKRALEKLVDLRLANYFSEPKSPNMDREKKDQLENSKFKQKKD